TAAANSGAAAMRIPNPSFIPAPLAFHPQNPSPAAPTAQDHPAMAADPSLLPDLEQAVAHGSPQRRAETLEQVTRLFLHQADALSDEQVALFGEVFERLIAMIETRSLAALSRSLAPVPTAPRNVVRR